MLQSALIEAGPRERALPAAQIVALDARRRGACDGPAMLARLAPREREIAAIIYTHGVLTANEARSYLVKPLSNSAIRSMLTRLAAKGVIQRRRSGNKDLFAPVAPDRELCDRALRRVCDDYFGGSLIDTAVALFALAEAAEAGGASAC